MSSAAKILNWVYVKIMRKINYGYIVQCKGEYGHIAYYFP